MHLTARILAQKLTERVGQSVIVDNRVGASRSSAPNTSPSRTPTATLLVGSQTSQAVLPRDVRQAELRYGARFRRRDGDRGVAARDRDPSVVPIKSVKDLIALAKARPATHVRRRVGRHAAHGRRAFQAGGEVDLLFVPIKARAGDCRRAGRADLDGVLESARRHAAGARRAAARLAVTSKQRVATAPDVPSRVRLARLRSEHVVRAFRAVGNAARRSSRNSMRNR